MLELGYSSEIKGIQQDMCIVSSYMCLNSAKIFMSGIWAYILQLIGMVLQVSLWFVYG